MYMLDSRKVHTRPHHGPLCLLYSSGGHLVDRDVGWVVRASKVYRNCNNSTAHEPAAVMRIGSLLLLPPMKKAGYSLLMAASNSVASCKHRHTQHMHGSGEHVNRLLSAVNTR